MTQKITHIIEKDRHGHVKHDVPITVPITSEEGDSELLAMSQKGASDIAAATRDKITDLVVVDRDGTSHSKTITDPETGEKTAVLQADEIGKIDGVKVNGEELPVDENGKVDIPIPQSVTDLEDADEYATKEDAQTMVDEAKVTGATLDYQEDGGSPSATVDFNEGSLDFTLKNMKMKYSDLEPEEKEELRGPQGIPGEGAIWTGEGEEIMALEQETGKAINKAMSQKAVTDEIVDAKVNKWEGRPYKIIPNLTIEGEDASYVATDDNNVKIVYIPVSKGDIVKVNANDMISYIACHISQLVPSAGVNAICLAYKNYNASDTSFDAVMTMPNDGYLCVRTKTTINTQMPSIIVSKRNSEVISEILNKMFIKKNIDLSSIEEMSYTINSNNKWVSTSSGNTRCKIIQIVSGQNYNVTSNTETIVAVLRTNNIEGYISPDFSSEFDGRIIVYPSDTGYLFKAPSDGHYLLVVTALQSGNTDVEVSQIDYLDDVARAMIESNEVLEFIDLSSVQEESLIIASSGKWAKPQVGGGKVIPIENGGRYLVTEELDMPIPVSVLSSDVRSNGGTAYFSSAYPSRLMISSSNPIIINAPSDGHFIAVSTLTSQGASGAKIWRIRTVGDNISKFDKGLESRKRIADSIGNGLTPLSFVTDNDGVEIPTTREIFNVQKKAQQMIGIEWTPLSNVPHNSGSGYFPANVPVQGMPYSSAKEMDKYVGCDVSIHTFMTAINNPYSLIYTENIRQNTQKSAWGKTYHGVNCGMYYGVVCNVLTCYATGQDIEWATSENDWCSRVNLNIIKVYNQSAQGLHIGDIYWKSGHNRLILGLKRDANGYVTHVKTTEAGTPRVWENEWITASAFNSMLANENGVIYRNIELYKNKYEPSEFVAVGDESVGAYQYNDDICTFAGDKASFREGELIVLNYNLKDSDDNWQFIEVYKNGSLYETYTIDEIAQSELPESQRFHALKLGTSLGYGQYKARIVSERRNSDWTYWEVIQTEVDYTRNKNEYVITWKSANGVPIAFAVCGIEGLRVVQDTLTADDLRIGSRNVDLYALSQEQHHYPYNIIGRYLKVYFQGKYGRVTNEPLLIEN